MATDKDLPDLSIVIPAFREERRIGATLDALAQYLANDSFFASKQVEVIVVMAESGDKTPQIVEQKSKLFQNLIPLFPGPRVGKGRDVQYGMLHARGRFVIFMDADLATPLRHIQDFYQACHEHDIVVGTRDLLHYRDSRLRGLFAQFGNGLYRSFSGLDIEDTQCGFKMFTARAARICFERQTLLGWGFDIEILAIAKANRLAIKQRRLNDWRHQPFGTYTDKPLAISVRMMHDFACVRWRQLNGKYG